MSNENLSPTPEQMGIDQNGQATRPDIIKNESQETRIKGLVDSSSSLGEMALRLGPFENIQSSSSTYSGGDISRQLTELAWHGNLFLNSVTNAYGIRDRAERIITGNKLLPIAADPEINRKIETEVMKATSVQEFFDIFQRNVGVITPESNIYSQRDIADAFNYAIKNPTDLERFRFFTRAFGIRDKAEEIILNFEASKNKTT